MSYVHVGPTGIDLYINFEVFIILYRVSAVTGQSRISGADQFRIWEWEGIKGVNQPGARHRLAQAACSTRAWEEQILFVVKTLIGQSWHFWPFSIWQWSVCGGKNENNQTIWHLWPKAPVYLGADKPLIINEERPTLCLENLYLQIISYRLRTHLRGSVSGISNPYPYDKYHFHKYF